MYTFIIQCNVYASCSLEYRRSVVICIKYWQPPNKWLKNHFDPCSFNRIEMCLIIHSSTIDDSCRWFHSPAHHRPSVRQSVSRSFVRQTVIAIIRFRPHQDPHQSTSRRRSVANSLAFPVCIAHIYKKTSTRENFRRCHVRTRGVDLKGLLTPDRWPTCK